MLKSLLNRYLFFFSKKCASDLQICASEAKNRGKIGTFSVFFETFP